MFKVSELKNKEIINLRNNEKLGYICDMEICVSKGEVAAIIIPEKNKTFFSIKNKVIRIPWSAISAIGEDVILVDIDYYCE